MLGAEELTDMKMRISTDIAKSGSGGAFTAKVTFNAAYNLCVKCLCIKLAKN